MNFTNTLTALILYLKKGEHVQYKFTIENLDADLLNILLADRTTGKNIIWATSDYEYLGEKYAAQKEITSDLLIVYGADVIQPRVSKSARDKKIRVREKAEIFTPAWLCNEQNNLIDEVWFGRTNVFNEIIDAQNHIWQATSDKIYFDGEKDWQKYVKDKRLEIACGEAPYLVSLYDTVSGEAIPIENRIGMLDRKFRVVYENTSTESDWLKWSLTALKNIYGYEFQGDNLFIARKNIFKSYVAYYRQKFNAEPGKDLLAEVAEIISWNLWQMDGQTNMIPYAKNYDDIFNQNADEKFYCKVKDWAEDNILYFDEHKKIRRR